VPVRLETEPEDLMTQVVDEALRPVWEAPPGDFRAISPSEKPDPEFDVWHIARALARRPRLGPQKPSLRAT